MCINHIRYFNKWTHTWQYSKCGKCPACQQEKAFKRTQRIKNATYNGYVPLFVTLTYRNWCIPYIRKSELKENVSFINIYRDSSVRRVRVSGDYKMSYKFKRQVSKIASYDCFENRIFVDKDHVLGLSSLRGETDKDKVGVLYFKDVQDFEKRLRINLERRYKISKPIYSFKCSELGPTTLRPHFHLLIYVPKENLDQCAYAISEAWPYASRLRMRESIEIARNASSYVSSYINRGSDFPDFFTYRKFLPRHSFSKGFGLQNPSFTLQQLIGSIRTGDLTFITTRTRNGFKELASILYPKYFLNYYFAKFVGYSRLTYDEICELIASPESIFTSQSYLIDKLGLYSKDVNPFTGDYLPDFDKIQSLINHIELRYSRFCCDFKYFDDDREFVGLPRNEYSRQLFADYYYRVWSVYASNIYKLSFTNVKTERDLLEVFYNLDEVRDKPYLEDYVFCFNFDSNNKLFVDRCLIKRWQRSDLLDLILNNPSIEDPNRYVCNIISTCNMRSIFNRTYKRRKVTNFVLSQSGHYV